jgi:hypothetical protein
MIRISNFQISSNFSRLVYEFYDEKMIIKGKSLTLEAEREINYKKIKVIQKRTVLDLRWWWVPLVVSLVVVCIYIIFDYPFQNNPTIYFTEKAVFIFGIALSTPAFRKIEYCSFLDEDRNAIVSIRVNKSNRKALEEAINLIKQKAEIISETYLTNPSAGIPPKFEIIYYDFPDYLNKSIARFYDDRIIDVEKSLVGDLVTEVKYSELSGKTQVIKVRNDSWGNVWGSWFKFAVITSATLDLFLPSRLTLGLGLLIGGSILVIPTFFLGYLKNEVLVFYNHNNEIIYWIRRNWGNQKLLDQIIELIQSKVSPSNPEGTLKS